MTVWSEDICRLAAYVYALEPSDMPKEPWTLKESPQLRIGTGFFRGGPFLTVTNNKAWLDSLKREIKEGPDGSRSRTGGLQDDLQAMCTVLAK